MFNLDLGKAEEPEIKLPTSVGSQKKQESSRRKKQTNKQTNIYFCFIDYAKTFGCIDHNKLWSILKVMGIADHLTYLLRNLYAGQEEIHTTVHGTRTGSKLGNEYIRAVYCHPTYLNYVQSTSCKMPGWMNHKLESRLPGEISITSDI